MSIVPFLSCVLLLMHQSSSLSAARCHGCEPTSCNCSRQSLQAIPEGPSKLIAELDLSFNRLRTIMKNDFVAFSRLQSLLVNNNRIQKIHDEAFFPLTNLEKLDLSFNRLETLSAGWFERNLFQPLKRLKTLHFGGPDLQSVRKAVLSDVVVIFKNVTMTFMACIAFLDIMSDSNLTSLALVDTKILRTSFRGIGYPRQMKRLEALVFRNVAVPRFYNFPALLFLRPLVGMVRRLSLLNSEFFLWPCVYSADFSRLDFMDVSDNLLSDALLSQMMCDGDGGLWRLQTINVSRNHLQTINSRLFTKLIELKNIDLSGNAFHVMPETCYWPPSLQFLNLSSTHLTQVTTCLPVSLRTLDLSDNGLTAFNIQLPFLTRLRLSGNKIVRLPDGLLYPRLAFLSIQNNNLQTFSGSNLNPYKDLKILEAAGNKYVCSCDFVAFVTSSRSADRRVALGDDTRSYVCDSPDAVRGKSAADAGLSAFECHAALALSLLCGGMLAPIVLVAALCHKFSVAWYLKMTWFWLRAKRRPKLNKRELEYDAFVSYSEMDSGWVDAHLVPELEQSEPPLRLCIHKRDFVPGGWILDNIMDAVEKSHRTLFVLSRHFLSSEWCKYELDYTHFRAFDQNDDTVVLILLEPIDKETVPKKFCRLRRVMNSRTYLEWPDDGDRVPRFWHSLKAALKRPDNGNCYFEKVD
uniref:Toll like receptor 2 n=1 Tax=Cyclopterus lumpus TaxID=8103 RepID=A0A8C3G6Z4_CYCLU